MTFRKVHVVHASDVLSHLSVEFDFWDEVGASKPNLGSKTSSHLGENK
jgi:hypothetical protein